MWWDKPPVVAFCGQEILDPRHLGWTLKRVVPLGADWTPWTLVPMSEWMTLSLPRRMMKRLKAARSASVVRLVTSSIRTAFVTYKYGDVTLNSLLASR